MRPYFLFPNSGRTIAIQKDLSTGNISLDLTTSLDRLRINSWFIPQDLVKQLRQLADYIEKFGSDGTTDKGKLSKAKVEGSN